MRCAIALVAVLALDSCSPPERAVAYRIESRNQLIGGTDAIGEIGDYMLENGRIRVVIQDQGYSRGNLPFGGGLIDADLVRPGGHQASTGGSGRDQFGEMAPAFFFDLLEPHSIEVVDDGSSGGPARLLVAGRGRELFAMTELLIKMVLGPETLRLETEYALAPGANYVEVTSRVINDDPRGRGHQFNTFEFNGTVVPVPMGDALIFSAKTGVFLPGDGGFEQKFSLEERYRVPIRLPALPGLVSEFLASRGDRVSYGLLPLPAGEENYIHRYADDYQGYPGRHTDHSFVLPFSAGGVMPVFFASPPDLLAAGEAFTYKRLFIVGSGDVASIADTVYTVLGDAVGTFTGRVVERPSLEPIAGASVVVLDEEQQPVNQITTRAGGNFRCSLRPGRYAAAVVMPGRRVQDWQQFAIEAGRRTSHVLEVDAPARLVVLVQDDHGRKIPARATLVGVSDAHELGLAPRQFLSHPAIGEKLHYTDMVADTADPATRRYVESIFAGTDGLIEGEARPGRYRVYISRGPEYTVNVADVDLVPDRTAVVTAVLQRVVDTSGYIGADFHLHCSSSVDSVAWPKQRLVDAASEGLEFVVATDHNYITDYSPTIAALDLVPWLSSMPGVELTHLEMGHFNGYPLRYRPELVTHGAPLWQDRTAGEMFEALREAGEERTVVQVNHPRASLLNYFGQFGLDNETLEVQGRSGLIAPNPESYPEYAKDNFSWDFDAIEILNGKRLDILHNYRVPEVLPPPPLPENMPPAGEVVRNDQGKVAFPGVVDDWLTMLNHGRVYTGTANSDSHTERQAETGYPRTYVGVPHDEPSWVTPHDVVYGLLARNALMTNCPFVRLRVGEATIGSTVRSQGGKIAVAIDVQTSTWCTPDQIHVYLGTQIARTLPIAPEQARHFTTVVELEVASDTFVVVEVTGSQSTFPIVPGEEYATVPENDVFASLGSSLGFHMDNWGNLRPQIRHDVTPYALTNPIFVDGDGDGRWQPRP
ncbi:MAG: CehA/McbA family metallohydrolase [Deltaproteobacteria bacterium]|nr:CehA/McbA family metallohydrolase [Deltaproteobacteria bacterium]